MARILLQTTIGDVHDDWDVSRSSLLADELRRAGHDVTARNRAPGTADPALSTLDTSDHDQLRLLAVDTGDGLTPQDAEGITRSRPSRAPAFMSWIDWAGSAERRPPT